SNKKFAVRCFHKESNLIEKRYKAISDKLNSLNSEYFVAFEFQPQGIRDAQNLNLFPIVKMAWAEGETLGEFLYKNFRNKNALNNLYSCVIHLASYLETNEIAHGDIQPGNVMVSQNGKKVQLIDYDGMYVKALQTLGSNELGHRNFQHSERTNRCWDNKLDRFSFISLTMSLKILGVCPELWDKTQSDGDSFIFRAADFEQPAQSSSFNYLFNFPQLKVDAKNFANVCKAPFHNIPSLKDFYAGLNIPQESLITTRASDKISKKYIAVYPVVDATDYVVCLKNVGNKVELIGKIYDVIKSKTKYGKPYIFINFGDWRGKIAKVNIWSEGLAALTNHPDDSWKGKWISVTGLMEPPYTNKKHNYTHLSVTITQNNQMRLLSEEEGKFRLNCSISGETGIQKNKEIVEMINRTSPSIADNAGSQQVRSKNQDILDKMGGYTPPKQPPSRPSSTQPAPPTSAPVSIFDLFLDFIKKIFFLG
ncbi:MAG: hypothetical protein LBP51_07710, partial [Deferribacteraceae bacterium]|nr:hypothetical protein [Deferribacteraceae bacterium]